MVNYFSRREETPLKLFEAPINFTAAKQKVSTINLISTMLFNHGTQFRIPDSAGSPVNYLTPSEYAMHKDEIAKYITRMSDIYDIERKRTLNLVKFCSKDQSRVMLLSKPGPPPFWFKLF
jgi:hypothetical protein